MNICVQRGLKKAMNMTLEEEVFTYSEFNVSLGYSIIQQQLYWNDNAINLIMILSDAFSQCNSSRSYKNKENEKIH